MSDSEFTIIQEFCALRAAGQPVPPPLQGDVERLFSEAQPRVYGICRKLVGDPERALQTVEPLGGEPFSSEDQTLLWDTVTVASEQTTDGALGLRTLDGLFAGGSSAPNPRRSPPRQWPEPGPSTRPRGPGRRGRC